MHNGVDLIPDYFFFLGFSLELRAARYSSATIIQWASLRGRNNSTYHTLPMSVEEVYVMRTEREGRAGRGRRARFLLLASYFCWGCWCCCCCSGRAPYKPNSLMNVFSCCCSLLPWRLEGRSDLHEESRFSWQLFQHAKDDFRLKWTLLPFVCVFKNVEFWRSWRIYLAGSTRVSHWPSYYLLLLHFWLLDEWTKNNYSLI